MAYQLQAGALDLADLRQLAYNQETLELTNDAYVRIDAAAQTVQDILTRGETVYGINTGFGILANVSIPDSDLTKLQENLVLSHAVGTGALMPDVVVRIILLLKINSLACGYSGARRDVIDALIALFNAQVYPCIPSQGSVGASGDLAPLAHMSTVLLGVGEVRHEDKTFSAIEGLALAGLKPLTLGPKEGLALLNGTQVSTALALHALMLTERVFASAVVSGSMAIDADRGCDVPFDARIHQVRGQLGQQRVAQAYQDVLQTSAIRESHHDCERVQDPYSLRCQPQVMGACLDQIHHVSQILLREMNAVSDNPLVFAEDNVILSGGNFHAQPIAFAADNLALAIAEIGSMSERRVALLIDQHMSQLPAFLVKEGGINSGFMIAQVTAAALVSENKSFAHPASVDSIPTSANQEDHVSMATFAARRLLLMVENTAVVVGIELLAACQGIEFHRPLTTSAPLEAVITQVRKQVPTYTVDRYFAPDIEIAKNWVLAGDLVPETLWKGLQG